MARQAKAPRLLTHEQIWTALDRLAARASLSPSGLARRAGLDPTTFNKSKRITADGRERWPSTESLAKALAATDELDRRLRAADRRWRRGRRTRCRCWLALAAQRGHFDDDGRPAGKGWDELALPLGRATSTPSRWRCPVTRVAPAYRDGDVCWCRRGGDPPRRPRGGEDRATARWSSASCSAARRRLLELTVLGPRARRPHDGGGARSNGSRGLCG